MRPANVFLIMELSNSRVLHLTFFSGIITRKRKIYHNFKRYVKIIL